MIHEAAFIKCLIGLVLILVGETAAYLYFDRKAGRFVLPSDRQSRNNRGERV